MNHDRPAFPHQRLQVYRVSLEMAVAVRTLCEGIPRGHRTIADQMGRASVSTVTLIAEGANRRGAKEKRQRFVEARGECGEAAAAAELALVLGLVPVADVELVMDLAARVASMLTRLIQRFS